MPHLEVQRLLEGRCLLEGGASMWIPKDAALVRQRRLFEVRRVLEEIRYMKSKIMIIDSSYTLQNNNCMVS